MKMRWLAVVLVAGVTGLPHVATSGAQDAVPAVTVYKSATCGCCSQWIEHMRSHGFSVKSMDVEDVTAIKNQYGVPASAGSCHTALVGGYVVEGHVPAADVKRLLTEKPKVVGIAVPGMPAGSPGMEVPSGRVDPYDVVSFNKAGQISVFEKH
jgi:hypothetical protein